MAYNFFPNANGTIPSSEYLKVIPRVLMKRVLLSDKSGVTETTIPDGSNYGTVIPTGDNKRIHSGGIIDPGKRAVVLNRRYFNDDFII